MRKYNEFGFQLVAFAVSGSSRGTCSLETLSETQQRGRGGGVDQEISSSEVSRDAGCEWDPSEYGEGSHLPSQTGRSMFIFSCFVQKPSTQINMHHFY